MTPERAAFAILGATGLTGRAVVSHLRKRVSKPLNWVIAGRDLDALNNLAKGFEPHAAPRILHISNLVTAPLEPLSSQVEWIANLAGPYGKHGDRVIESCLNTETHYLDICGEVDVIGDWVQRFDARARALSVQLIPAAGFESLPFDLVTRAAVERLKGNGSDSPIHVDALLSYRGLGWERFSRYSSAGTIATTLETLLRNPSADQLLDVLSLCTTDRDARGGEPGKLALDAGFDDDYRVWRAPLIPGPFINPAIINRSNFLLSKCADGFGPAFRYSEAMNVSSIAPWPLGQSLIASTIATSTREFLAALGSNSIRRESTLALWRNLASQQTKLEDRDLDTVDYQLDVRATGRGSPPVRAQLRGAGHPGYRSTGNIIGELLLGFATEISKEREGGVLTPAVALGPGWLDRLAPAGLECCWS